MIRTVLAALVAICALSASTACTLRTTCDGRFHFHKTMPEAHKPQVRAGVAKWNAFADKNHQVELDENGNPELEACSFRQIPGNSAEYREIEAEVGPSSAVHRDKDKSIVFIPDQWESNDWFSEFPEDVVKTYEFATMHELAHSFGMGHLDSDAESPDVMGILNPQPRIAFTCADRLECLRVGACSDNQASDAL